jgi:predicted dehydrogenase
MEKRIGIVMNGVTGRVGTSQHLPNVMAELVKRGVPLKNGDLLVPDPLLVGRDEAKLAATARRFGMARWTTDLDLALSDSRDPVYFDCTVTGQRFANVERALNADKHVYCEKPLAATSAGARRLARLAAERNRKNGVVMSDLWLPGMQKLRQLADSGFFGEILAARGDFGYWVHAGDARKAQRPSWNYRKEDGGGMVMDMMCHWHYLLEQLIASPSRVCCVARTLLPKRWDENDRPYAATADDMAMALVELSGGVMAQLSMSWCTRVRRDDLLTLQVDGTQGSAVAGIHECFIQAKADTPTLSWKLDGVPEKGHGAAWTAFEKDRDYPNPFQAQWRNFLRHVAEDADFPWNFAAAARGVDFIEACLKSAAHGDWEALQGRA